MEEKTTSFEENMKKLEEIATELEKGDLDLDTSEDGELAEEKFVQNED